MNVVICPRCDLEMIAEEYRSHNCIGEFRGTKTIPISYYYEAGLDKNEDMILMMISDDGFIYRMIHCRHKIPHNLLDVPTSNTEKMSHQSNST